jgi:hypothetical protein
VCTVLGFSSSQHLVPVCVSYTLDQAMGFGIFALKAVLGGRRDELVELVETNLLC